MKSIYSFVSLRAYLKAYYQYHKKSTAGFSFESFSRAAGMKSPNYLKLVMDGERDLSVSSLHRFARALGLSYVETQYFEALVFLAQASDPEAEAYYSMRLSELRHNRKADVDRRESEMFFSRWHHPAILLCIHDQEERQAAQKLRSVFGLSRADVKAFLDRMLSLGVVRQEGDRLLLNSEALVMRDVKSRRESYRRFIRDQLRISMRVLDNAYDKGPRFISHSFTIGEERFAFHADRLQAFLEEMTATSNLDRPDRVVQLNIQMFDLAMVPGEERLKALEET